jgi:cytochrome c553
VAVLPAAAAPPAQLVVCAACHGQDGNSEVPDNPKLAGLDADYLERQLKHFKGGERKNPIMSGMAATLSANDMRELAEYFSEQAAKPGLGFDPAEAAKGKAIFDDGLVSAAVPACSGCHGNDGVGDAKYPRLAGQHPSYVARQLAAFKSGERTNDLKAAMSAVAKRLS